MKNGTIKQPVRKGAAKVPVVMQMEALECGAACLTMVMAYYGKWVPLEQVRLDCGVSRDGSSAKNILLAARNYGFAVQGYRCEPETLREQIAFPCIIHWNFNHFVVLDGFRGKHALLNDPARGEVKVTLEEFDRAFTGVCLELTPGPDFAPGGKRKSTAAFARRRLTGAGGAVAFVALSTAIGSLFGILNPVFSRFFLDRLLTGENRELLTPFLVLLLVLGCAQIAAAWVQAVYSMKINGKLAIVGSSTYMWKVLSLPMAFFSQRMAGDLLQRKETNAAIAGTLVNTFGPLVLNTAMMVFYLAVMLRYSVPLTVVGLVTILINLLVSRLISRKRVNLTRVQMRDGGKLAAATVSGIQMVETIKSSGAEAGFFRKWAGYQAAVNTAAVRFARLNQYLGLIPVLVSALANAAVLILGVWLAMEGSFTLGMILSFQGFLSAFLAPAMTLVSAGQTIQEMRTEMERVEDVMAYPADQRLSDEPLSGDTDYSKLKGNVELKHVTFGYSPLAEPLIRDFSMSMKTGSRVAFVGATGCGKSTLIRLLLGFETPEKGAVYYDGKDLSKLDLPSLRRRIGAVTQDGALFQGDIYSNIVISAPQLTLDEAWAAAELAGIADDIRAMPMGMQTVISEGQGSISGGQKQRLMIARAVAPKPRILLFDEATSALDNKTQKQVSDALDSLDCTRIVVAHRLSTIRHCDRILVLDKGRIVEDGDYETLVAKNGLFAELVARQRLDAPAC